MLGATEIIILTFMCFVLVSGIFVARFAIKQLNKKE